MRILKTYKRFLESLVIDDTQLVIDIMESLNIWHDVLLSSISAEELDIYNTLKLSKDMFSSKIDIETISDNVDFINALSSIALKKSQVHNTDDYECFINKSCKFMFIYDIESNEIENPQYVMFQVWNETINAWADAKLYKVNDDVKKFYDKLSSKTIEITDGDENYIYVTSNGNDWELQNLDKENDIYQRYLKKEELQKLLSDRNIKLMII
jgi:hypothetical protein